MMTTTKTTLTLLEADEQEAAQRLLEGSLKRNNLTRAQLRDVVEAGHSLLQEGYHPTTWNAPTTPHDVARQAAARLLARLCREIGLPLEAVLGASGKSVLRDMLG